jgi:hypothetical protein
MKAKRQIESSLYSVTMLDGTGGHVSINLVECGPIGSFAANRGRAAYLGGADGGG